ncbi:hypothetical protein B0T16DRAFT_449807 [Cercophora newfieldiana]|uniref:Secreted protein n=1 Tax=Cercophora newfieldiana TaxID=92897 RepID=A0AA39XRN5_9PEZI|nr:hypothetical protein B0T16DRAFT_449807 [Cercophora newfieldiana]
MYLNSLALALGTALLAANGAIADILVVNTYCKDWWPLPDDCTSARSVWVNDFDQSFPVDANTGCRNPGVPHIPWFCIDWDNARLKFYPTNQPERCMPRKTTQRMFSVGICRNSDDCHASVWREVQCNW